MPDLAPLKRPLAAGLAAALAACATAPPPADPAVPAAPATQNTGAPAVSAALALLSRQGGADAPTAAQVQAVLGPADVARQEAAGAILTYRLERCALVLLFALDAESRMRLVEAAPHARQQSAPAPSLDLCAAELDARRARAPVS